MMTRNDYDREIFNGDQGVVLWISDAGRTPTLMAVFPRATGHAVFPLGALRGSLQPAFAMTVHKSQGSEFDHIALVLPDEDLPLNTREILYTALTRARRSVTIIGRPSVFEKGVERRVNRLTGIADHLAEAP
jgi:exodeoxyribonuclease V alpha subunit